jgi:hypothetical protein
MYGCFDAVLVYGFEDPSWSHSLNSEWLEEYGLRSYASSVIRRHLCSSVYGAPVELSPDGCLHVDDAEVAKVDALHSRFLDYIVAHKLEVAAPSVGFQLCVSGDYESEHTSYTLDD